MADNPYYEKPMAALGLLSYRYKGTYGWIMIGARNDEEALREARRSLSDKASLTVDNLERWDPQLQRYKKVQP